jgi:predicted amidohydrolase
VDNPFYVAWGHSMIVDPWGNILSQADKKEEIIYSNLNPELINSARDQIPIQVNKRDDIYKTVYVKK